MTTFTLPSAEIFVPDGLAPEVALRRSTILGIAAHQDDLEILSFDGILRAFGRSDQWYTGVVMTNGSGSPRANRYATYTDEQMMAVRRQEQKKAAVAGEYGAMVFLDYPSAAVKSGSDHRPVDDLDALFRVACPDVVYTHNLADKHDTHVGVALKVITALRALPPERRPKQLIGGEVWRDLDWLRDEDKIVGDLTGGSNLAAAVLGVFDSQIAGGKRYDLATLGRRRAHATYFASHATDKAEELCFCMDLTPLLNDPALTPETLVERYITRFAAEVVARIRNVGPSC